MRKAMFLIVLLIKVMAPIFGQLPTDIPEAVSGFSYPLASGFTLNGGLGFGQCADYRPNGKIFYCKDVTSFTCKIHHPAKDWNYTSTAVNNLPTHLIPENLGSDGNVDKGVPVFAAANGTVLFRRDGKWDGLAIIHEYGNTKDTFVTVYGHVSGILVNAGDHVVKGQQIAVIDKVVAGSAHLYSLQIDFRFYNLIFSILTAV